MITASISRKKLPIRRPGSPEWAMAYPTSRANTMICSILPSAMARTGLDGTMSTSTSASGGGGMGWKLAAPGISTWAPGSTRLANSSATLTAMAVVARYRPMVLTAMGPIRALSPSELAPQISDTSTSGTTNSFSRDTKTRPTTSSTPFLATRAPCSVARMPSGSTPPCSSILSTDPSSTPASMASSIRLVRLTGDRTRCDRPPRLGRHRRYRARHIRAGHPLPARHRPDRTAWYTPRDAGRCRRSPGAPPGRGAAAGPGRHSRRELTGRRPRLDALFHSP